MDTQDKVLLGYHTQKLLADTRPDKEEITQLQEKMSNPPETVRERLLQERIDRRLNIIPDQDFQKVIEKLPREQAKILVDIREQAKERQRLKELERAEKEHAHSFERSR
jgi:predicted amino acid-binding ACT domain protein